MKSYFACEEPGFAWHNRYEALSYHTASRHVQQNVFTRAAKQAPSPLLSGTISLAIHPMRAQLRRGAKFHPSKDKFMKKD
ncbi:hypothetical protein [uncultured Campylobacter sp.]|uniref:hypothetical protein n=1 Tax=uncultured Campylobacter sp. TaxID=218934 RepID=UPI002615E667|nr:hypothetical protein [uncultured Campylobacter sp.]